MITMLDTPRRTLNQFKLKYLVLGVIFLSLMLHYGAHAAYWEHSHEHDWHQHLDQHHERFDETAIRSEEQRHHHQEEYAEYATR